MNTSKNQKTDQNQKSDEKAQIETRKAKLSQLKQKGPAFPNHIKRDILAHCLHAQYGHLSKADLEALSDKPSYTVAGRMMFRRIMGKASFIMIQDMSGKIQAYIRKNDLPSGQYAAFKSDWDIGDIVAVKGQVFKTNTGELTIHSEDIHLLTKAIRPLPDKFHGLSDQKTRYRQRYLDLIMNPESRIVFERRAAILSFMRRFFESHRYMEVETPMMQTIPGGAAAKPFITYHNALDMSLYLRIAPELYLKRLIIGGFERVFEINRNFRNEGLSTRHNPEFTMLEFYQAYADYTDLMDLTETMLKELVTELNGEALFHYQGETYDLTQSFGRMSVFEAILNYNPQLNESDINNLTSAQETAKQMDVPFQQTDGLGKIQAELFEKMVEPYLKGPVYITHYPAEISPLARLNDANPFVTDRFELFIGGREIANGFSELNDPEDQAERFRQQLQAKDDGDEEAMYYDADYIKALEHGMPPTAGEGIGIDRLVMLLTDQPSIKDVLLFPHMKPESQSGNGSDQA